MFAVISDHRCSWYPEIADTNFKGKRG